MPATAPTIGGKVFSEMSLATDLSGGVYAEPKAEDIGDDLGLEDIDMADKAGLEEDGASQDHEEDPEDKSQVDEEMEDLFGDDKDVEEVKHEGYVVRGC